MRTVESLIGELQKFPPHAKCHAHEGEVTGVIVRLGGDQGVIHCREGGGLEEPSELFKRSETAEG